MSSDSAKKPSLNLGEFSSLAVENTPPPILVSPGAADDADCVQVDDHLTNTPAMRASSSVLTVPEESMMISNKPRKGVFMIEYGVFSEQGTRKTMEDQHRAMLGTDLVTPRDKDAPRTTFGIPFFGVFDGHGGTQCADFLREHLHALVLGHPDVRTDPQKAIREAVVEAEEKFLQKCRTEHVESGSTVAVAMIINDAIVTGNVGDSEIVLCRGGMPLVLTTKHNPSSNEAEAERVRSVGGRIFHGRVGHPKFNPMLVSLAVSRAIGDAGFKLEEYTEGKPSGIIAEADTQYTEIHPDDEFMIIGCDGLWDVLPYDAAVQFCRNELKRGCTLQDLTEKICQEALRLGSTDNVTAVIVNLRRQTGGGRPASAASIGRARGESEISTSSSDMSRFLTPNSESIKES